MLLFVPRSVTPPTPRPKVQAEGRAKPKLAANSFHPSIRLFVRLARLRSALGLETRQSLQARSQLPPAQPPFPEAGACSVSCSSAAPYKPPVSPPWGEIKPAFCSTRGTRSYHRLACFKADCGVCKRPLWVESGSGRLNSRSASPTDCLPPENGPIFFSAPIKQQRFLGIPCLSFPEESLVFWLFTFLN